MPLYEAIRRSRRTLLVGDLGTGKSTLGAQLVVETIDRSETAVAAFVPAKELQLKDRFTTHQFLETIDDYLTEQVIPGGSPTDVRSLLENKTEVLLVIDGLDEVPQDVGGRILRQAATMPEHWPTIQIVATARPIEFAGVSYPDWRLAYTVPLDDDAKRKFIAEEMVADGVDASEADDKANSLLRSLKEMPALDSIANSPLAIRLIYPRLRDSLSRESLTVGDLLYELLLERLGGWQKRDDKPATFDHFDAVLPTSEGKVELLAVLAQKAVANRRITVDEAKADLRDAAADIKDANKDRLADEALACFEWLGLIARGSVIEFPLQPLVEVSAAAGLLARWRSQASNWTLPDHAQWRVVSFAAAIARRRGWLAELREPILRFINTLLLDARNVPATCYVVVEASDNVLAKKTVEILPRLGFRPLTVLGDEQRVSVRNIAKTLWLAGEPGFNWLFDHYLSPKYPISSGVGWVVRDVFEEWANLARGHLAETDKNRLTKLVKPYLATGEAQFFGVLTVLAVVVPEAFELDDRLWYQSLALDRALFSGRISEEFLTLGKSDGSPREHLNRVLQHRAAESERAAILWLELNSDVDPAVSLIRQAFQSRLRRTASSTVTELSFLCRSRLGEDRWLRFARWTVSMSDRSGAGAAIVLIDAGEKDLSIVGDALISAMHDGGYFAEAERVLDSLVRTAGEKGLFWLGSRMAANWWDGAHSGCWRVLLSRIGDMRDGPEVLAKCVKNMGPYTLPRYPEVREAFLRLLDGPQGTEFRGALRAQLHSLDPDTRRGAALILTSADPRTEAEALFVAIRSRADDRNIDWHEWETFCLTLDFGPSVLSMLKSRLQLLEPHSRVLALVILLKGAIDIEPRYRAELESNLLMIGNWHLARDHTAGAFLRGDDSLAALITKLNYPTSEVAENAAGMLLDLYRGLLPPKVEAKCIAIRTKAGRWSLDLPNVMAPIVREADFAASIKEACEQIRQQRGAVPFLEFVLRANNDPSVWKDVVWSMLCDDTQAAGASSEADSNGEALLEYGLEIKEHGKPIGEAAIECLNDPRTKSNRWIDAYQWLAVIGDEFVGLKAECMRDALLHGQPIRCSAAASLIARLDELPLGVVFRHATSRRPILRDVHREADQDRIVARLKEYSRDSADLHPDLLASIEECLFLPAVSETTLSQIASIGKPGILVSNALRCCYGASAKLAETLPLLDIWGKIWAQATNNPHLRQLLQLWMVVRESAIRGAEKVTNEYLATLDERLADGEMRKLPLASEILRIRGSLSKGQVGPVFLAYARYPSFLHEMLFGQLAKWLGGGTDEALKNEIIEASIELSGSSG